MTWSRWHALFLRPYIIISNLSFQDPAKYFVRENSSSFQLPRGVPAWAVYNVHPSTLRLRVRPSSWILAISITFLNITGHRLCVQREAGTRFTRSQIQHWVCVDAKDSTANDKLRVCLNWPWSTLRSFRVSARVLATRSLHNEAFFFITATPWSPAIWSLDTLTWCRALFAYYLVTW